MAVCEICNNKKFTLVASRIREGEGKILQCNKCGLVIQDLDWEDEQIRDYYENNYQCTHSLVSGKIQSPREHFNDRLKTIIHLFEQIRPLLSFDSKVLEVGCGAGALLSLIKPHVARCVGVELYNPFVDFMKKDLSIETYAQDINSLDFQDNFDLIICISTLDHLPNPLETLTTMKKFLSPSGKIYIEVPNCNEALNHFIPPKNRKKYNEFFWHHAHLFYFTKDTISALFEKAGLKVQITCRHDYTLKNFLNWYFLGKAQPGLLIGMSESNFFEGKSDFEMRMNQLFVSMEEEFKKIMRNTFRGDSLCCTGWL